MIITSSQPKNNQSNSNLSAIANTLAAGSVSIKDIIAPSYVEVDFNHLKIDNKYYRTLYVVGYPRYVSANSPIIYFNVYLSNRIKKCFK